MSLHGVLLLAQADTMDKMGQGILELLPLVIHAALLEQIRIKMGPIMQMSISEAWS